MVIFIENHEYAPQGQTIITTTEMSSVAYVMRPELSTGNWRLHHDNAPAHSSRLFRLFFGENPDSCGSPGTLLSWYDSATSDCCPPEGRILYFNNENPTRALNPTSLNCCLPSTDAIERREKNPRTRLKVASCKRASMKSTRFSQKKKGRILF